MLVVFPDDVPADAREWPLLGPLQMRNLSPFSLLRMDFMPPPAAASLQPGWDLEARLTHANTYVLSDNVSVHLEARDLEAPLSEQDIQTLLTTTRGDLFYFDGSVNSLDLSTRYVLDEHWTGFFQLPLLDYSGSFLDSVIDGFHDTFGYGTGGRDLVARDEYQVVIRHSGDSLVLLDSPSGVHLGDPVLGVRYTAELAPNWFAAVEGAVKLPVGDVDDYVSSGEADYGVHLTLQKQFGRQALYLSLSNVWLGSADRFPNSFRGAVPEATLAYEFGLTPYTAAILQTSWSKTAFRKGTSPLSADEHLAGLGLRHRRGKIAYDFALMQNFQNYDNTSDVALSFGVTWLLGDEPVE
jgi:hypothetical protein